MMLAVGAYSGPRAVCGAVAQLVKNARHVAAALRRIQIGVFDCLRFMRFAGVAMGVGTDVRNATTDTAIE
jgi:hypothetical protein